MKTNIHSLGDILIHHIFLNFSYLILWPIDTTLVAQGKIDDDGVLPDCFAFAASLQITE